MARITRYRGEGALDGIGIALEHLEKASVVEEQHARQAARRIVGAREYQDLVELGLSERFLAELI